MLALELFSKCSGIPEIKDKTHIKSKTGTCLDAGHFRAFNFSHCRRAEKVLARSRIWNEKKKKRDGNQSARGSLVDHDDDYLGRGSVIISRCVAGD